MGSIWINYFPMGNVDTSWDWDCDSLEKRAFHMGVRSMG